MTAPQSPAFPVGRRPRRYRPEASVAQKAPTAGRAQRLLQLVLSVLLTSDDPSRHGSHPTERGRRRGSERGGVQAREGHCQQRATDSG